MKKLIAVLTLAVASTLTGCAGHGPLFAGYAENVRPRYGDPDQPRVTVYNVPKKQP